jgi:hypothetical protein
MCCAALSGMAVRLGPGGHQSGQAGRRSEVGPVTGPQLRVDLGTASPPAAHRSSTQLSEDFATSAPAPWRAPTVGPPRVR